MVFNSLRSFHEVARTGSIRKASEALNLAPSSVSRQILILERQIGAALLDRSTTGATLTAAGKLVAHYARTVILDYDTLRTDIEELKGTGRAIIHIAAVESLILEAPLAAIEIFRARFPDVQFRLRMLTASEVAQEVRAGACDIGITINQLPDPTLKTILQLEEPLVLAVRRDHHLAQRASVTLPELADEPLALHETAHAVRQLFDEATRAKGFLIAPVLSSSSLEALRGFVRAGLGGAILTRSGVTQDSSGDIVAVPFDETSLTCGCIVLLTRAGRRLSRNLRLFVAELSDALQQGRGDR